jgi:hypothetical protein
MTENTKTNKLGDMPPDDFRRYGHEMVDWLADYYERIEDLPVLSSVSPGWLTGELPGSAPESGEDFSVVIADLDRLILPAVTNWHCLRHEGNAVADCTGVYRTRGRHPRLAASDDGAARAI